MRLLLTTLLLGLILSPAAHAGIFDDPENLKVLDEDIGPRDLGATMRGFAMGLGVRCTNCHVGEEGQPLDTFDFASDEKEQKLIARQMLRMVAAINDDFLAEMDPAVEGDVGVTCVTCHRGQNRPLMLADHLDQALTEGGVEQAVARYGELRDSYYGSFTFDFSEWSLISYADALETRGEPDAAMAMLQLNVDHLPQAEWTLMSMASVLASRGDVEGAIEKLDELLVINPDNMRAASFRARLQGG
jgi:tetratricopeptide (TPR) repeat protein